MIAYYRTFAEVEVDCIVETARRSASDHPHIVAIEVKLADKWNREWEKPLRSLASIEGLKVDKYVAVYTGSRSYHFDPIDVMPVGSFIDHQKRKGRAIDDPAFPYSDYYLSIFHLSP